MFEFRAPAIGSALVCMTLLGACVSSEGGTTGSAATGANAGDNVARVTGSGNTNAIGFSTALFPATRTSVATSNTTIGDSAETPVVAIAGVAAVTPVSVLTFNTASGGISSTSGSYDPATIKTTVNGSAFSVASDGGRYSGRLIAGGNNLAVVIPTPNAGMPTTSSAQFNGSSDVIYVNAPTSQTFTGTMNATVTANFATGQVDVRLDTPTGQIDGVAYANGGSVQISNLGISGAGFANSASTTGSVTGFVGASDLNSGSQTVTARGLFGGPNAEETAAIAQITDGANGTAILRLTARQ